MHSLGRILGLDSGSTRLGSRKGRCITVGNAGTSAFVVLACLLVGQVQIVVVGAQGGYGLVLQDRP